MKNTSKLKLSAYLLQQVPEHPIPEDDAKRYRRHHLLKIAHWMFVLAQPRKLHFNMLNTGLRLLEKTEAYLIQVEHVQEHSIRKPIDGVGILKVAQDFWSHVRKRAANAASLEDAALAYATRPTKSRGRCVSSVQTDRQIKVAKNDVTVGLQHHILQFDVSMNDSKAVKMIDRARLQILHEHASLPLLSREGSPILRTRASCTTRAYESAHRIESNGSTPETGESENLSYVTEY